MRRTPSLGVQLGVHAGLVLATMIALYPVLWVVKVALSPDGAVDLGPSPIPRAVSMDAFTDVTGTMLGDTWLFGRQLFNSLVVATATATVGVALATSAAWALSRFDFPGKERGMAAVLITQMFPGVVMAIPLYLLLDTLALLDSLTGLVLVYATTSVPFSVFTLKGWFDTLPRALEEAAIMDGASRWQTFRLIILPLARPALAVTFLFSFMAAWNEFVLAATLLGDPRSFTLPVVLQRYVDDHGTAWGPFAAGAVLVSVPVVALFFALQRHLVEGLTAGAVKG
jgi:arabinogalactan oligomer/maltooligosaccharide transport system permease protein